MSHLSFASRQFGMGPAAAPPAPAPLPLPAPGSITAVVGASGAGKTRALARLAQSAGARLCKPLTRQQLARPVLSLFPVSMAGGVVLRALAQCGLADATIWRRRAHTLSAGEQRRLELALATACSAKPSRCQVPVIVDEFDAHLDGETALCLAASLARLAAAQRLQLVISTHRPECLGALNAKRVFEIDGENARELPAPRPRDLLAEISIERGSLADYARFARWHYLGSRRPGPVSDVFVARFQGRAIAVATFGPTHLFLSPRNAALPKFSSVVVSRNGAKALNAHVRLLQRVVVEPRFRALGVASQLLKAALPQLGVRYVECLAEMGQFCGFLERAGFERKDRCKLSREAARLSQTLMRLGLRPQSLLNPRNRRRVLARLTCEDREKIERQLIGLCRSRIETGAGRLRGRRVAPEALLQRALLRLHCQPEYFLWSSHESL
ncbi:MAG: hypothetical protein IT461_08015 [Planctomycetes bacterium]|nr:hypothetical protein [Planctomycetota bacterium]